MFEHNLTIALTS